MRERVGREKEWLERERGDRERGERERGVRERGGEREKERENMYISPLKREVLPSLKL